MQESLFFLKEELPNLLSFVIFMGCSITAIMLEEKRLYFLTQWDEDIGLEEKKTLIWYNNLLGKQIYGQIIGMVVFILLIQFFNEGISRMADFPGRASLKILSFLIVVVSWIIWMVRRSRQKNLYEKLINDIRPPVLFLRNFTNDGEAPLTIFEVVSKYSKKPISYEDLAIGPGYMIGPVIAIAAPYRTDKEVLGASKGHFENWQSAINMYMQRASLIIMRPYYSEGVLWEFEQAVKLNYLNKTVLYINFGGKETKNRKKLYQENEKSYHYFRKTVLQKYGIDLGDYNPKARLTYFDDQNEVYETNDYFEIPVFRKVFYDQYIIAKNKSKLTA